VLLAFIAAQAVGIASPPLPATIEVTRALVQLGDRATPSDIQDLVKRLQLPTGKITRMPTTLGSTFAEYTAPADAGAKLTRVTLRQHFDSGRPVWEHIEVESAPNFCIQPSDIRAQTSAPESQKTELTTIHQENGLSLSQANVATFSFRANGASDLRLQASGCSKQILLLKTF
jgi:hypothetical protein